MPDRSVYATDDALALREQTARRRRITQ